MSTLPAVVRELLACPRCRGSLAALTDQTGEWLGCESCNCRYAVRDGIPLLLIEQAERVTP